MFNCPSCPASYEKYKSLHRHKSLKHPETIQDPNKAYKDRIAAYEQNPSLCASCNTLLSYNKRKNKFCNHSCAASVSNASRDQPEVVENIRNAWRRKLGGIKADIVKQSSFTHTCVTCSTLFTSKYSGSKYCKPTCNVSKHHKAIYRAACAFKLNPIDHKSLYKFDLMNTNGWYCPSNKGPYNPNGVTWDHLYRVEDGFENNVPPEIMSHPANAEMVTWVENVSRKTSQITYDQLLTRIQEYNKVETEEIESF